MGQINKDIINDNKNQEDKNNNIEDQQEQQPNKDDDSSINDDLEDLDLSDSDIENDLNKELTQEQKENLFYDDQEDDENEQWVQSNLKKSKGRSDAYLSCPCCFTLVCVDCQRHDRYKNQYRAMFVRNCKIDFSNRLVYQDNDGDNDDQDDDDDSDNEAYDEDESEGENQDDKEENNNNNVEKNKENINNKKKNCKNKPVEYYHEVYCSVCSTKLAVFDQDEIYHFFNIFPSNA